MSDPVVVLHPDSLVSGVFPDRRATVMRAYESLQEEGWIVDEASRFAASLESQGFTPKEIKLALDRALRT